MTRAVTLLRAAWWWLTLAAVLAWWTPALGLVIVKGECGRLRFLMVILAASALREVGATGAATWIYRRERRRCDRRMAAIRARRVTLR